MVPLDCLFYKGVYFFALNFANHIAVGGVAHIAGQGMLSGTGNGLAAETDALDDDNVYDIVSFHTLIV